MGVSSRGVRADAFAIRAAALNVLIIRMGNSHEHADVCAIFEIEHLPAVLDGFPRGLEQQTLLRIDIGSLARGNAEELRVELVDLIKEPAALGDGFSGDAEFRIIEALDIPSVGRYVSHRIAALFHELPK